VNNYTFGVGVTGYDKLIGEQSPHNVLIEVLCYSGIIGLSIFIFFLYKIGQSSYRILKSESNILPLVFFVNSLGLVLTGQIFAQKIIWLIFAYQIASVSSKAV
jgi:O-antigen ligase